jgi:MarR family transcriptional regulator, organic hydroperoxide resistance regulator
MDLNKETIEIDNLIRNIDKLLNRYTQTILTNYDLTLPGFYTLWMISKLEPTSMGKLTEKMMAANSTLTVTVDHLVKEGFVKRYRDNMDRRVVLLETTLKGKEQLQLLLNERQKFFQQSLMKLGLNEQQQFINLLKLIHENLRNNYKEINTERDE